MATDKKIPSNLVFSKEKFRYNTIQDVINDTGLTVGLVVETDGYNTLGDGFDAKYLITNVNEQGSILLKNGYYAKEISNSNGSKKLNQGNVSTDYDTAEKIEDKIKEAQGTADNKLNKGSLPATIPDGKTIYDLLENNGGLNIDTALLYLNDSGTKTKGKVYFDKNKKGLFECIKTTTNTVNSTEFFVDISNKASSDRLNKLSQKAILLYENSSKKQIIGPIILNDYISNFKEIILILGNKTSATVSVVDLMEKTFHTDSIIYNEDATLDNQKGDYSLITHGEMYGFATCYFRKSKKEIYIARPLNEMSVLFKVYGIY